MQIPVLLKNTSIRLAKTKTLEKTQEIKIKHKKLPALLRKPESKTWGQEMRDKKIEMKVIKWPKL